MFPGGFGQVIDPEGDAQLEVLPALKVRLGAFKAHPVIGEHLARLDEAEAALKVALAAGDAADTRIDALFAEEQAARQAIRVQLESAYGRLRDLYKTRPALAEAFFLKESGSRRAKKDAPPPAEPAAPAASPRIG